MITNDLKALLDNGSKRGLPFPEREQLRTALLLNNLPNEAGLLYRMTAFLKDEAVLPAENVLSLANVIAARAGDPTGKEIVESIVRQAIDPGPRKKRKKYPVPADVDRTKLRNKFPGATQLEALSITKNRVLVQFKDRDGKPSSTFLQRKAQPKFTASRSTAVIPKKAPAPPAPPPRKLTPREQWKASATLKETFPSAEIFESYTAAKLAGHVH